ncbi:MAG TPA: hypothetical protein VI855_01980 [Dehalococcoidia bacterium]|nr:hypothetical protein [Dehalococcoidia bacterium]
MVHAVQIIDGGNLNVDINVFKDSITGRTVNVNTLRNLLRPNERNDAARVSQAASDFLQMLLDRRDALADLAQDDPAVITDPALPGFFQARVGETLGQGQNAVDIYRPIALIGGVGTHLIGRETLVTVVWDGVVAEGHVNLLTETPPTVLR